MYSYPDNTSALSRIRESRHVRYSLHDDAVRQLVELAAEIGRRTLHVCGCFSRPGGT